MSFLSPPPSKLDIAIDVLYNIILKCILLWVLWFLCFLMLPVLGPTTVNVLAKCVIPMAFVVVFIYRTDWKTYGHAVIYYLTGRDARPIFKCFREARALPGPICRHTTGTLADVIDMIIVYYAWMDWRRTLVARLVSPRYARHPCVRRALCYVQPRVVIERTFGKVIQQLRAVSTMDPELLYVRYAYMTLYVDTVKMTRYFDVSDAYLPRVETDGPGTITLYTPEYGRWEVFDFRTHVHDGKEAPKRRIMSTRIFDGHRVLICDLKWRDGLFVAAANGDKKNYCILEHVS